MSWKMSIQFIDIVEKVFQFISINPVQPLNPNSLFECVRLGECTPPNVTNSTLYCNDCPLVDHDAETEDCVKYHMHSSGRNLP